MFNTGLLKKIRQITGQLSFEEELLCKINDREKNTKSILFFNHHKCASTFTTQFLECFTSSNLKHVNYSKYIESVLTHYHEEYNNHEDFYVEYSDELFSNKGYIYGPLRKPFFFNGMEQYKSIFFLRDPRDTIISYYYSMVYSHRPPQMYGHIKKFYENREYYKNIGLEKFCQTDGKDMFLHVFDGFKKIHENMMLEPLVVTYSQFRKDHTYFIKKIIEYIDIDITKERHEKMVSIAMPKKGKGKYNHIRSAKSKQYQDKLNNSTQQQLQAEFEEYIEYFHLD